MSAAHTLIESSPTSLTTSIEPAIAVRRYRDEEQPFWDSFVYEHPSGSPFHLIAWKRLIEETYGYRPIYLVAESNSQIQAVLPLFLTDNLIFGKALLSSPFAVYGGVLARSREAATAMKTYLETLGKELGVQYIELRNSCKEQCLGFSLLSRYVTFRQSIEPNEDALLATIPRKTRYIVRKSLKQNFASRSTQTDLSVFVDLYTKNLKRLGTPCFPHAHFSRMVKYFPGMVEIREVRLENQSAAAVLSFYFRDQVLPYYGASEPSLNASAPSSFMYFDLMRSAAERGCRVFDFGRSKKIAGGSHDFKSHWGMQTVDLPYEMLLVRRKQLPNLSPANPAFSLPIRLWRTLPLWVTRVIGPRLIRFFP